MTNNVPQILHATSAAVVVASSTVLMALGKIDPSAGVALIAAAGGFTLGGGAVSIGANQSGPTTQASNAPQSVGTVPTP